MSVGGDRILCFVKRFDQKRKEFHEQTEQKSGGGQGFANQAEHKLKDTALYLLYIVFGGEIPIRFGIDVF